MVFQNNIITIILKLALLMSTHLYKVTAKKDYGKLAKGMFVEIVIRNTNRKPTQREVIEAINLKYGDKTAVNGLSMTNFEIVEL